jgi:hypothetical protein
LLFREKYPFLLLLLLPEPPYRADELLDLNSKMSVWESVNGIKKKEKKKNKKQKKEKKEKKKKRKKEEKTDFRQEILSPSPGRQDGYASLSPSYPASSSVTYM